ncbi:MAG: DUF11 domain-containing protein, partial [Anaerolineae bacterium]|nr:DUF11 domain-containing protein [Anaerolineae bacterium]
MSRHVRTLFILAIVLTLGLGAVSFSLPTQRALAAGPDLAINKSHTGDFTVGVPGTYNILIQNVGDTTTSSAISVTEQVPTGLILTGETSPDWDCPGLPVTGPANVTCNYSGPALVASATTSFNVTVSVLPSAVPSVTNGVQVNMTGDASFLNDIDSDPTTVNPGVDLTVTKFHTGNFTVGTPGTYTIRVQNNGSQATSGTITVLDTLPVGFMSVSSATGPGWTCSPPGGTSISCTSSDVIGPGGTGQEITLVVNTLAPGTVDNTAEVSGGGGLSSNSTTDSTIIQPGPDLAISKSHPVGDFTVGNVHTYTITVNNIGSGTANPPFAVVDTLPAQLTFQSGTGTGFSPCTAAGQVVTCNASLPIGAGGSATITLNVVPNATGTVTNTAQINPTASGDNNAANNNATDPQPTVIKAIDLSITKSHTGNFSRGLPGVFNIAVTNNGDAPTLSAITVTDNLPAGLTFTSGGSGGFACSAVGQAVTCTNAGPIGPGATITFPINVDVSPTAPASMSNTASVATNFDVVPGNNTSPADAVTIDAPDLTLTKTVASGGPNFARNTTRTFRFVVTNAGAGSTFGTTIINDTLPPGLFFSSAIAVNPAGSPPWATPICTTTGGGAAFSCTYNAQIPPTGTITLDVDVDVDPTATLGPATNTATAVTTGDVDPSNNSGSVDIVIDPAPVPDLTVTKANGGTFTVGSNGTFVITVTNQGNLDTNFTTTIVDTLPPGFNFVSSSPAGWTCSSVAGPPVVVTCDFAGVIGQGAANAQAVTLTVTPTTAGAFTNNVTVSGGGEVNTANNAGSSTGNVSPAPAPDAAITKTASGTTYVQNVANSFTIAVSNAGAVDINAGTTVTVTDNLSSGMTYVAAGSGGTGWTCPGANVTGPGSVVCTHSGPVTAGASLPNITLNVLPTALGNIPNSATVSLTGQTDGNPANNTSTVTVNVLPPNTPDLRITKTHADPFTQGVLSSYSIAVENVGSGDTTGIITVTDTLPPGMTFSSASGGGFTCSAAAQVVTCTSPG